MQFKKITSLLIFIFFILASNLSLANEKPFINLDENMKDIYSKRMVNQLKNDDTIPPLLLTRKTDLTDAHIKNPLIFGSKARGKVTIKNSTFEKDIIVFSDKLKKLTIDNTKIKGDLYIIGNIKNLKINNSSLNTLYINSNIKFETTYSNINRILLSKNVTNIENYNYSNVLYNFPEFMIDLNDFTPDKGFCKAFGNSSYGNLFAFYKDVINNNKDFFFFPCKNATEKNIELLNTKINDNFMKYYPNNSSGIISIFFSENNDKDGIIYIYFIKNECTKNIGKAALALDTIYNNIKDIKDDIEYIRKVNQIVTSNINYDNSLENHSLYNAVVEKKAVCDGYSKMGYELLKRRFGKDNTILIENDNHMWNMVNLNNYWYHIDFTHNDSNNIFSERYLLLSDSEIENMPHNHRTWNKNNFPPAVNKLLIYRK